MVVPVRNLVETVDLTSEDALLPLLECVVNSIISLQQSDLPVGEKKIQIKIERGEFPRGLGLENVRTISSFKVTDNGVGFNSKNFESFETPFSHINKDYGCKGIGRFTVLAAYDEYLVDSTFKEGNLSEDKLEEHLYRISFNARKNVERNIQKFIDNKSVNEEAINEIIKDIKEKTAYDVDSLADYMTRRKAILELLDKFLNADERGEYKLEEDVHNLIFPLGLTNNDVDYENHNLWLLDERFITYRFIASDRPITAYSQKKSKKELDLLLIDSPQIFDNPISFGDRSSGEINSMVIFEFKRPGSTAHQKRKTDYRWQFSDLIGPYFEEFLYQPDKKNYKGNQVVLHKTTPKFGFVILDVIPPQLAEYNLDNGWKRTPFGTFFYINPAINLHIEVMTFRKLLDFSVNRHNPFFDKLFTGNI